MNESTKKHVNGIALKVLGAFVGLIVVIVIVGAIFGSGSETKSATQTPKAKPATANFETLLIKANPKASWLKSVASVEEVEPGRLTVSTSIVDPRGANDSPAAKEAIAICKASVSLLKANGVGKPYVAVLESDGTHFVLYGHPAYPHGCTEV